MADLKPVGSEKLPLDKKLQRIMEIANYGMTPEVKTHKTASLEYTVKASDGNKYGIIRENAQYMILKEGTDGYDYMSGMRNNSRYSFNSYSEALKKLNLLMKPLNENYNGGKQLNLIGEQEEEDTKFVLKQPEPTGDDLGMEDDLGLGDDLGMEDDLGGEEIEGEMDLGVEDDMGGEEIEGELDVEVTDDEDATKAVQKLTGKLGQKLRDLAEPEMTADIIKYVLNSIISAVDLEKLSSDDKDEIVDKFEDEDIEYTEEGEFDVEMSGEEELDLGDDDMGDMEGEDLDMDMDLESELAEGMVMGDEETNENLGALARMAVGAAAAGFGERAADKVFNEETQEWEDVTGDGKFTQADVLKLRGVELDEEGTINFAGEDDDPEAVEAIADIFNESRVNKTLSKYFKLTEDEKILKEYSNDFKKQSLKKKKENFLNESIKQVKRKRLIESSFSSYEQERTTKRFLNENRNFNFVGKNKRGGMVFKRNKNLVEITTSGKVL